MHRFLSTHEPTGLSVDAAAPWCLFCSASTIALPLACSSSRSCTTCGAGATGAVAESVSPETASVALWACEVLGGAVVSAKATTSFLPKGFMASMTCSDSTRLSLSKALCSSSACKMNCCRSCVCLSLEMSSRRLSICVYRFWTIAANFRNCALGLSASWHIFSTRA